MIAADKFAVFCNHLRMSDTLVSNIHYRVKHISHHLWAHFQPPPSPMAWTRYVGSFGRGTAIDATGVDLLVRLPDSVLTLPAGESPAGVLHSLQQVLALQYPQAQVNLALGAVCVGFNDGVRLCIIPGFWQAQPLGFITPLDAAEGSWQLINPDAELTAMDRADGESLKNLRRLCRMLRVWNQQQALPLSHLALDALAYDFMKDWKYRDKSFSFYDWMCRDFFAKLKNLNEDSPPLTAPGSLQPLTWPQSLPEQASQTHSLIVSAIQHAHGHQHWQATAAWKGVFGERFLESGRLN